MQAMIPMKDTNDYVLVGLTGSIGAGKSLVAACFAEAGIPVLNADAIAKELMAGDPEMRRSIVETFGGRAFNESGLDRKWLAAQVFNNREKLDRLNDIVHPRTIAEQGIRARKLIEQGNRVVACEAALIFESGGVGRFDYIVVVDARPELRYQRAAERDGVSVEEVGRRDAMQISAKQKVDAADFVIENNGTEAELRGKAAMIASLLKVLPPRHSLDQWDEEQEEE